MKHTEMLEWEKLARKYDENAIPLYLSYPVESFWRQDVNLDSYIESLKENDFSFLYFHFPYCATICHYCMCYKETYNGESDNDKYIQYLVKEIDLIMEKAGITDKLHTFYTSLPTIPKPISTCYFPPYHSYGHQLFLLHSYGLKSSDV